jgi:polar amino acid transport system substrate-binding protein
MKPAPCRLHRKPQRARLTESIVSLRRRALLIWGLVSLLPGCSRQDAASVPVSDQNTTGLPPESPPASTTPRTQDSPNFIVHAKLLPGLVDSRMQGPLIDLMHALDEIYVEGTFHIEAFPIARVYDNLAQGRCDIALPQLRVGSDANLSHRFSTVSLGKVSFVLYVNRVNHLTRQHIENAVTNKIFTYQIEAPPVDWGFPVQAFHTLESALKKVDAGRIDALLWAQEDADNVLRELGLKNIRRIHFGDYDDIFMLNGGKRGELADRVLSEAVARLRSSGRLEPLHQRIHRPFVAWQPQDGL